MYIYIYMHMYITGDPVDIASLKPLTIRRFVTVSSCVCCAT